MQIIKKVSWVAPIKLFAKHTKQKVIQPQISVTYLKAQHTSSSKEMSFQEWPSLALCQKLERTLPHVPCDTYLYEELALSSLREMFLHL